MQLVIWKERDTGEGDAGDGRGHSVTTRNLEGTLQLEAESVFLSPLTKSKMFLKLRVFSNIDNQAKLPAENKALYN